MNCAWVAICVSFTNSQQTQVIKRLVYLIDLTNQSYSTFYRKYKQKLCAKVFKNALFDGLVWGIVVEQLELDKSCGV